MRVGFDSLQSIIWQTVKRSTSRKVGGIILLCYNTCIKLSVNDPLGFILYIVKILTN